MQSDGRGTRYERRTTRLAIVLLWCSLCAAAWGGGGTVYSAVPPLDRSYVGPTMQPFEHQNQRYNVFAPDTPPPPGGYPLLLHFQLGGWVNSHRPTTIDEASDIVYAALEAGYAVVWASTTVSRGGGTGNPIDEPPGVGFGPAYPGNGVFIPPGTPLPPGYTATRHPYEDPTRPMPEKDLVMLVQHVKEQAATGALPIDPERIVLHARSAAAVVAWWVIGPDRSDLWTSPTGQELHDTSVAAALIRGGVTWWGACAQTAPPVGYHFPRDEGSTGGFYDVPATDLNTTRPEYLKLASALTHALNEDDDPGVTLRVYDTPIYLAYGGQAVETSDFDGPPWINDVETDTHSAWFGAAWKTNFCSARFGVYHGGTLGLEDVADVVTPAFAPIVDDMLEWMHLAVDDALPSPWSVLAGVLPGAAGHPTLLGCGTLVGDEDVSLQTRYGPAFAPSTLVIGLTAVDLVFKGGVLVPSPDLQLNVPLDGDGRWTLGGPWPTGVPAGVELVFQTWIADPGGPQGFSATNALRAVTP